MSFTCPRCGLAYGDPFYHGPAGHAPQNICCDCWVNEWEPITAMKAFSVKWAPLEAALWLIAMGCTQSQAAGVIGVHRTTVNRWLARLRSDPRRIPDWLVETEVVLSRAVQRR